ncbi:MAG: ABC transporter permease [bacterium]|nr:ABC transporter permease [bacterium]
MRVITSALETIGGITILSGRVARMMLRGGINLRLLLEQMVLLGVNSIPIAVIVLSFAGAVFTFVLAEELASRGAGSLVGGLQLLVFLQEMIPVFSGIVMAGKIGAAITSEIGTMKISEQLDALRALSTDPDWYLTVPRVLAGIIMMPVVAVFAGYGSWFAGYAMAHNQIGLRYSQFASAVDSLVSMHDFRMCFVKCMIFGATIVLVSCHSGYVAQGGAAGVGKAVTNGVVLNIVLIFLLDLLVTMVMG